MVILPAATAPFAGWSALRDELRGLGAQRLLRVLLRKVYAEMPQSGYSFVGDPFHNYVNHPVIARVLVRMILDGEPAGDLDAPISPAEADRLCGILAQLNELARSRHVGRDPEEVVVSGSQAFEAAVYGQWINTFELRGRHAQANREIARAWAMLRWHWPKVASTLGNIGPATIPAVPLLSAFDSLEHVTALYIAFLSEAGYIETPEKHFLHTALFPNLSQFLALYAPPARDVVGEWSAIEGDPLMGLGSPFRHEPVVALPSGALVAPDPGQVFSGFSDLLLRRAIIPLQGACESQDEAVRLLSGRLFESYAASLVSEIAALQPGVRYEPEFEMGDGTKSLDSFLISDALLLMWEFKALRLPEPNEDTLHPSGMYRWLRAVAGADDRKQRGPYKQISEFVRRWQRSPDCISRIGPATAARRGALIVVVATDPPPFLHWRRFREGVWREGLDQAAAGIDQSTLFLSINDVEELLSVGEWLRTRGQDTPSPTDLLMDYLRQCRDPQYASFHGARGFMKAGLRDFLADRFPERGAPLPTLLSRAYDECMLGVRQVAFPDGGPDHGRPSAHN